MLHKCVTLLLSCKEEINFISTKREKISKDWALSAFVSSVNQHVIRLKSVVADLRGLSYLQATEVSSGSGSWSCSVSRRSVFVYSAVTWCVPLAAQVHNNIYSSVHRTAQMRSVTHTNAHTEIPLWNDGDTVHIQVWTGTRSHTDCFTDHFFAYKMRKITFKFSTRLQRQNSLPYSSEPLTWEQFFCFSFFPKTSYTWHMYMQS